MQSTRYQLSPGAYENVSKMRPSSINRNDNAMLADTNSVTNSRSGSANSFETASVSAATRYSREQM